MCLSKKAYIFENPLLFKNNLHSLAAKTFFPILFQVKVVDSWSHCVLMYGIKAFILSAFSYYPTESLYR